MNTIKQHLFFATALIILASCHNNPESTEETTGLINITNQQFTGEGMQLGEMETKSFENSIKCNGMIVPQPDGKAIVNALIPGVVKVVHCANGKYVEKNQPLIEIGGNEVIDIQRDYAEAAATFKRVKNEYERIKTLYEEKVTTEKEYIIAESAYQVARAEYNALKSKMEAIGLSGSQIEQGDFYSSYLLKSPIKGYISSLTANIGSYVDPQAMLCEIADPDKFQLRLSVFADNISTVSKGQTVRFKPVNSGGEYFATISAIGISMDSDSKSIDCYAEIQDESYADPIANVFVEAEIITRRDTVHALPSDAIIKTESGHALLVLKKQDGEEYFFEKVDVSTGRVDNGYTEITGKPVEGRILVKGAYNVVVE